MYKRQVEAVLAAEHVAGSDSVLADAVDPTLPGLTHRIGAEHPLIRTSAEIVSVFQRLCYSVALGPEVETDSVSYTHLDVYKRQGMGLEVLLQRV